MLKSQIIGMLVIAGLMSCQKKSSPGSGGSGPNVEEDTKDEGSKSGSTDDGNEIAIVNLTTDLGACNSSRRGKSYYVLAEKKFRYCADSDQWDVIDLKGSDGTSGAAGKNSLVLTTSETAGANCATGGQKIQSGLDQNSNGQLDVSEVTATSFACNGAAGSAGAAGRPSLVAVTAENSGANCATGGNKVRSGLDANSNGTLEDGEVQSTSFVCHGSAGAQGVAGAAGTNGKNSLVKSSVEPAGANCASGGRKIEFGSDTNSDGVLAAGEVSGATYVCNGSTGATGAPGNDGADGDRYVGRILYTSAGTRLGEVVYDLEYLSATSTPPLSSTWVTPDRLLIVKDEVNNRHVGYVASSKTNLNPGQGYTQIMFRTRKLEDTALSKLATIQSSIVYSNSSCNNGGAWFAYNMTQSYKPNSGERNFSAKAVHDYLTSLGLTMAYNLNSTSDIAPNCGSPTQRTDIGSHNSNGTMGCEILCRDMDVGCSFAAVGQVCPFTTITNVFPDSIAAGWSVQRN